MTRQSRPEIAATIIRAIPIIAIIAYIGLYFALVQAGPSGIKLISLVPGVKPRSVPIPAFYRHGNYFPANTFFAPIHWIDRRLRPGTWNFP